MTAAIGPRVGGAHVDVNMKFDDRSLAKVGQRIHAQLADIGKRNGQIYREIGEGAVTAWRAALGSIVAAGPHIGSAISAVAGSATNLAGALYSVGQSAYALLPIATSLGIAGTTLAIGFEGFGNAINETDPKKLAAALERLTPDARSAALALRELKLQIRRQVQTTMFQGLTAELGKLSSGFIPAVSKGFGNMAKSINGLIKSVLLYVNSKEGLKQINGLFNGSASIFKRLATAVVPFLDGFLRLVNALTPAGERLADKIANIALKFQTWTKAEGYGKRINDMMLRAEKTAGLLFKVFSNTGKALANVFNTANPATNSFLQMLVDVTDKFLKFTQSAEGQNSIAKWAMDSVDVMRQFGRTIAAIFKFMEKLSDPRLIESFLKTVENAFNILGKLPLDKVVSKFADLAEKLQPISGPMLAIVVAGAAFNVLLGNLMGQIGGFVAAAGRFTGVTKIVKGFFTQTKELGKHADGVGKFTTVFRELGGFLSKGLKFAGLAGLIATVVYFLAQSKEVRDAVSGAFKTIGESFSKLMPTFQQVGGVIGTVFGLITSTIGSIVTAIAPTVAKLITVIGTLIASLAPLFASVMTIIGGLLAALMPVVQVILNLLIPVITFVANLILNTLISAINGAINVVQGLTNVFMGIINFVKAVFAKDWSAAWDAVKQIFSGVWQAIVGVVQVLWELGVMKLIGKGLSAIKSLWELTWNGVKKVFSVVWDWISGKATTVVKGILDYFKGAWESMKATASTTWNALKTEVGEVMGKMFTKIKEIGGDILEWFKGLPGSILRGLGDLGSILLNAGKSIIGGFFQGIKDKFEDVKKFVGGIGSWISEHKGPLDYDRNLLIPAGQAIMTGLNKGLTAGIPGLDKSMKYITSRLSPDTPAMRGITMAINAAMSKTGSSAPVAKSESYGIPPGPLSANRTGDSGAFPSTMVIVDADGALIGRMRVEAQGIMSETATSSRRQAAYR